MKNTYIYLYAITISIMVSSLVRMAYPENGLSFYLVYVIILFSFCYSLLARDFSFLVAVIIISVKPFFLTYYYPPLASKDAYEYYSQAFLSGSEKTVYDMLTELFMFGKFSIIEMTSVFYHMIAVVFGSVDPIALVYANYFLMLWSACIFSVILKFNSKQRNIFLLLVVLSPLISKYSTFLLKEALSCFLVVVMVYLYVNKRSKLFFIVLMIISTIIRPYSVIVFLSYVVFLGKIRLRYSIILSILVFVIMLPLMRIKGAVDISMAGLLKDSALSFFAILAAPNFLRISSWLSTPFLVFESLVVFIFVAHHIVSSDAKVRYRTLVSIILLSIMLGGVSYNRSIRTAELHSIKSGSLLSDDIARKKFAYQLILLSLVSVRCGRFRLNEKKNTGL